MRHLNPDSYTIAWIAPLEIEARAALCLFDEVHSGELPGIARSRLCVQRRIGVRAQCGACDPAAGPSLRNGLGGCSCRPGQDGLSASLVRSAGRHRRGLTRPLAVATTGHPPG